MFSSTRRPYSAKTNIDQQKQRAKNRFREAMVVFFVSPVYVSILHKVQREKMRVKERSNLQNGCENCCNTSVRISGFNIFNNQKSCLFLFQRTLMRAIIVPLCVVELSTQVLYHHFGKTLRKGHLLLIVIVTTVLSLPEQI